jgi:hypothetical protein
MRFRTTGAIVLGALLLAPTALAAQDRFEWTGRLAPGQTIEIKGVNGAIEASAASGDQVRVTATKRGRRSNPADVRIDVVEHAGGVTICAVYPTPRGREPNECVPGSGGRMSSQNNDVNVRFEVQVPRGVAFAGRTVNGNVHGTALPGDAEARTVNGNVRVTADGIVRATTVNGSIDVGMGRADWTGDLELETVNGGIRLTLTGDVHAHVSAATVNGSISTDYPLTVQGSFGPRRLRGTIGDGGRNLELSTVNGSISILRR